MDSDGIFLFDIDRKKEFESIEDKLMNFGLHSLHSTRSNKISKPKRTVRPKYIKKITRKDKGFRRKLQQITKAASEEKYVYFKLSPSIKERTAGPIIRFPDVFVFDGKVAFAPNVTIREIKAMLFKVVFAKPKELKSIPLEQIEAVTDRCKIYIMINKSPRELQEFVSIGDAQRMVAEHNSEYHPESDFYQGVSFELVYEFL
eukprot:TRINITY_DN2891_c0_g1_i1.p1 TRINITY_DN2891_c0_g1~~TRINITY_DN2891_c0_g1_i1.p1  ORF type:complete len:202 (-),score=31.38 TRINITY_DN2891_c0_g1_i1:136-741(-)